MAIPDTFKPAFTEPPGTSFVGIPIKGLVLPSPYVAYGRAYYELCAHHCLANDIKEPSQLARYSVESTDIPAIVKDPTVPLITIPTSLSGGEYFSLAGGTDDTTEHKSHKHGFLHSGMGVRLIILDAQLATLTPEYHWLSTGIRSVDHCVEALCCLTATPEAEDKAERGLRLLVPSLLRCKADANDVEARHRCQMAVNLAMDNDPWAYRMGSPAAYFVLLL
ncbi:Alcohol dehydrogenase, iron-type [Niveomyces insectorum RCEF 264]|uniref:Alcohol dehydrogenase, iron-type n=1 Tax=Niveomyces insectorum RCEF 264 TaxID=1081102 RepID=A0A167T3P2_9HYPO|nr:Alcohol dehydrogenase, iron-type [Niveomyces insectorum RCEF 264]